MNIPESAIEAAFESFPLPDCGNCGVGFCTDHIDQAIDTATAALTAALPYLEAALRTQIAEEIRLGINEYSGQLIEQAARIAEKGNI